MIIIIKRDFEMTTSWYSLCQEIEPYKNYFESISDCDFHCLEDLSIDDLLISVPHRTCQPISDGECYLRNVGSIKYVKNNELENALYLLSSGKISLYEILQILSVSEKFNHIDNLESAILDIYKQFDKERLVVWKKSL